MKIPKRGPMSIHEASTGGEIYKGTPIDGATPAEAPLRFAPPIRIGSWVRRTNPLNVLRVGYPRDHRFYTQFIKNDPDIMAALKLTVDTIGEKLFGDKPRRSVMERSVMGPWIMSIRGGGLIQGAARQAGAMDGLGGGQRRIFWWSSPVDDCAWVVRDVSTIVEGDYYPPSGGGEDYEDGGLANKKHWRIIHLDTGNTVREHVTPILGGGAGDRWKDSNGVEWLVSGDELRMRDTPTVTMSISVLWPKSTPQWAAPQGEWGADGWTFVGAATERTIRTVKHWTEAR